MKDYIAKNSDRAIPVGYSAADVRDILMDTVNYMSCNLANATNSRSDFFGLNSYSWCGQSSYTVSGYNVLTQDFSNASLPVFFSEYGCNLVTPRTFTEVQALYGQDMTQAFSGGLVYEWTQEANNYGLVQLNDNNTVSLLVDYYNLQSQYNKLDIKRLESSNATQTSVQPATCNPSLITDSGFLNTFNLPSRAPGIQDMIDNGVKAKTGKLVKVTATAVPETVYDDNGNVVSGIALQILADNAANAPGQSSPTGSPTSTGGTASPTKKGDADRLTTSLFVGLVSGVLMVSVLML